MRGHCAFTSKNITTTLFMNTQGCLDLFISLSCSLLCSRFFGMSRNPKKRLQRRLLILRLDSDTPCSFSMRNDDNGDSNLERVLSFVINPLTPVPPVTWTAHSPLFFREVVNVDR